MILIEGLILPRFNFNSCPKPLLNQMIWWSSLNYVKNY